jgi:hypothetical protein
MEIFVKSRSSGWIINLRADEDVYLQTNNSGDNDEAGLKNSRSIPPARLARRRSPYLFRAKRLDRVQAGTLPGRIEAEKETDSYRYPHG